MNAFRGVSVQNYTFLDGDPLDKILFKLFSAHLQKYLQEGVFPEKFSGPFFDNCFSQPSFIPHSLSLCLRSDVRTIHVAWGELQKDCTSVDGFNIVQLCGFYVLVNFIV